MSSDDTEHRMIKESVVLQRERIEIKSLGLVKRERHEVEETVKEYQCSCGETFENGSQAYHHLDDVRSVDTETKSSDHGGEA